jgi:hypothetical protein
MAGDRCQSILSVIDHPVASGEISLTGIAHVAINIMRGATSVGKHVVLPEQEAFDIEYWILEEAKLQRMPKPKSLAGRVAFIVGGVGGVGRAIAARVISEGACVVLVDVDAASLQKAVADLGQRFGADLVRGVASTAPFEETSLEPWSRDTVTLAARTGYRIMKDQGLGGSIVFVGSKDGATYGIRVNAVSPETSPHDAETGQDRRRQSLPSRRVGRPDEIAEAVYTFASDLSAGCTGNVLRIEADSVTAFAG